MKHHRLTASSCLTLMNRNEAVSILGMLLQAFSNSKYWEQVSQPSINHLWYSVYYSYSISATLPQPPGECHTGSAFPQTRGKLDRSPGKAAQHKRNVMRKSHPLHPLQQHNSLLSRSVLDTAALFLLCKLFNFYQHNPEALCVYPDRHFKNYSEIG